MQAADSRFPGLIIRRLMQPRKCWLVIIVTIGGEFFNVVPLSVTDWIIITVATSLVLWIGEIGRVFSRLVEK